MAVVKILQYPDPRLKTKAKKVQQVDKAVQKVIDDMFETHYAQENCAALAATQLDFAEPLHITVIDFSEEKNQPLCLINAEIIDSKGEHTEEEGCMSVYPQYIHEKVKRASWIKVRALNRQGETFEMEADGFMAKCIQHELDHLDGKIYLDRLSGLRRSRLEKKIAKAQKLS